MTETASSGNSLDLFAAIRSEDLDQVNHLLASGADPDISHPDGYDPLTLASTLGQLKIVRALIEVGADVDSPEDPYYTYEREWGPLTAAIVNDHAEIVKELIQAGADARSFYDTDRSFPEALRSEEITQKLDRVDVSCTALYLAIASGNAEIVQAIVQAVANPDAGTGSRDPLDLAVELNRSDLVRLLLDAGADVNSDMEDYERAIMGAAWVGNMEVVRMLVESGAELNTWSQANSAIVSAAMRGHEEVLSYLVEEGIKKHGQEELQEHLDRALDEAARKGRMNTVHFLGQFVSPEHYMRALESVPPGLR